MAVTRVRYSEAFKRQVVERVERGDHGSLNKVAKAYGIGGMSTIAQWIRKYG
ncbi:MAG: transposase, partial [Verrucomicrobia bacterium]|nr:transposase [Verrucomicrobiota bacterium]